MAVSLEPSWHWCAGDSIAATGQEEASRCSCICTQHALPRCLQWESIPTQACLSIINKNWTFFLKVKNVIHVEMLKTLFRLCSQNVNIL